MSQTIACPSCGHLIPKEAISTPKSRIGAKEVDNWTYLKRMHMKLMAWGISGLWASTPLSKDEIHRGFNGTTVDGINARISELRRAGVVERMMTQLPKEPNDNPHKSKLVKYRLNVERAVQLLNNGGRLK